MEIIKLNLIPSGVNPTCHCSQYDNGRVIRIELFDGLTPYVLQSGDTVTLNVRKPDNTIVTASVTATQGNNYVDIVTTEQICAVVGYNLCDLTITNGSVVIGTLNFIMQVERDVLADGIPSQSVIEDLDELVQEAVGDNYYTKTEVDDALALKADKSTTYTKTEIDALSNDLFFSDNTISEINNISWERGSILTDSGTNLNLYNNSRIRTKSTLPINDYNLVVPNNVMVIIYFYYGSNYVNYKIITGENINIKDYAATYSNTATQIRFVLLFNPEATIGDGTSDDYSSILSRVFYYPVFSIGEVLDTTSKLKSFFYRDVNTIWTRGNISTSTGEEYDQYTTSRIRSNILSTNIYLTKNANTILLLYFYNAGTYVTYKIFSDAESFNVSTYAKMFNINADSVRFLLLFNPESTIGDGTSDDYSSILSLVTFKEFSANNYKDYVSGFQFFKVKVNPNSPATTGDENEVKDIETYNEVTCYIKLPPTYLPYGKPTKLLMICHGAGRGMVGSNNWTTQTGYNNIVNAFINSGFAVFDCQGYADTSDGSSFWGAKQGVLAWRNAYNYIIENYNVTKDFVIYGFSMGGLTALGLAFDCYPNIKAIALSSPVLDLTKCVIENTMQTAYNLDSATYDVNKCFGCNPFARIFSLNSNDIVFAKLPPIKIWYGGNETNRTSQPYVEKLDAQKFVNAVKNGGGYAIYREVVGVGHEICYGLVPNAITEYNNFLNRF